MARPVLKPCVVVDTREQCPLSFNADNVNVVVDTLSTGDYSLRGAESSICVERKSLDDLVSTVIHNRERFERELERMHSYPIRVVVVEASWMDLAHHHYVSQAHPSSVFGLICSMHANYGVPFLFCETRAIAARYVERLITSYFHGLERNSSAAKAEPAA